MPLLSPFSIVVDQSMVWYSVVCFSPVAYWVMLLGEKTSGVGLKKTVFLWVCFGFA
jgi:hypothetical protein